MLNLNLILVVPSSLSSLSRLSKSETTWIFDDQGILNVAISCHVTCEHSHPTQKPFQGDTAKDSL